MIFVNSIFKRRSVRAFTQREVENEKIDQVIRAAMQAPSAANQQPWEFIVVRGAENLEALSLYSPYAACLKGADVGIVVVGNQSKFKFPDLWEQDLAAATQNLMLQATELGLGTVWFGTAPDTARMLYIKRLYNLADDLLPFSVIAVGYPQDENANQFIDRYDESRIRYVG